MRAHLLYFLIDAEGEPVTSATVTLRQQGTSTPITEPVYAADSGGAPLANPLTSGATDGKVEFYIDNPKRLDLFVQKSGVPDRTFAVTAIKPGVNFRGAYSAATTYNENDAVTNGGETWIALRTVTGVTPVEGADWSKLAAKGTLANHDPRQQLSIFATAYRGTAQSVTSSASPVVDIDTVDAGDDAFSMRSGSTFVIPYTGRWDIAGHIHWASNATGIRGLEIQKNGVDIVTDRKVAVSGGITTNDVRVIEESCTAGDIIRLRAFQSSGGALDLLAGRRISWLTVSMRSGGSSSP